MKTYITVLFLVLYSLLVSFESYSKVYSEGIHWISFPQIMVYTSEDSLRIKENNVDCYQEVGIQFINIMGESRIKLFDTRSLLDNFDGCEWMSGQVPVYSHLGYKMESTKAFTYCCSGPKLPDVTKVSIRHISNGSMPYWLGFWKEGTYDFRQYISPGMTNNCNVIKHQNWFLIRTGEQGSYGWEGDKETPISYGEMVELTLLSDFTFYGYEEGLPIEVDSIDTGIFTFEEQRNYIPMVLEILSKVKAEEVEVFLDGVCKGSGKVYNGKAYIRLYLKYEDYSTESPWQFVYSTEKKRLRAFNDYHLKGSEAKLDFKKRVDFFLLETDGKSKPFKY